MFTMALFGGLMNAGYLLGSFGPYVLVGLGVIIFIESGVLFPFLPGDSLLITATILRGDLHISAWEIALFAGLAAVAGDQVGFYLGRRFGRRLFKDDAKILRTDRLVQAEEFFANHGSLALVLGRFVPIVRTFVPFAAGTPRMPYKHFVAWNAGGALAWVGSMVLAAVFLGDIPGLAHSIDLIMIVIVFVSLLPVAIGWFIKHRARVQAA